MSVRVRVCACVVVQFLRVTTDPESVMMLASMGFTDAQATRALRETGGDMERAADWLFSRGPGDLDDAPAAPAAASASAATVPVVRALLCHMHPRCIAVHVL
jgi:ubiquitin carboxyl-terminal hydrolase 5/13